MLSSNDILNFLRHNKPYMYILIEKHTTFQLKTIPLINAYLLLFNNNRRLKNDKYERKTRGYYSAFSGW